MERTKHVMLVAHGAEELARSVGLELCDDSFFDTPLRLQQLQAAQSANAVRLDHDHQHEARADATASDASSSMCIEKPHALGTVGAVALDRAGRLAAATSTGGMTNKLPGRVGDSGVLGAGTFADRVCAISCTGDGERFIEAFAAHEVSALMRYSGLSLQDAAQRVIHERVHGSGGLIAVDASGAISMPMNCSGMFRAAKYEHHEAFVAIYADEGDPPSPPLPRSTQ